MSAICMFWLKNVPRQEDIIGALKAFVEGKNYGICLAPCNSLLLENSVCPAANDIVFELTNSPTSFGTDDLLAYPYWGVHVSVPLLKRLQFIQDVALLCREHVAVIDIYLSEDNGYLPDYSEYCIAGEDIAKVLYREYMMDWGETPLVPDVHIIAK